MNAYQRGRDEGFDYLLTLKSLGSKRHFEFTGKIAAQDTYKTKAKQDAFIEGWMENWTDRPAVNPTTPDDEILTF